MEIMRSVVDLVGEDASGADMALARAVVEAQLDLRRILKERETLLSSLIHSVVPKAGSEDPTSPNSTPTTDGHIEPGAALWPSHRFAYCRTSNK